MGSKVVTVVNSLKSHKVIIFSVITVNKAINQITRMRTFVVVLLTIAVADVSFGLPMDDVELREESLDEPLDEPLDEELLREDPGEGEELREDPEEEEGLLEERLTCGRYGGRWACVPSCMAQNCATGYCRGGTCRCSRCGRGSNH